ncbi:MAG: hypothetical protein WBD27_17855 [Pyrinomonadaceae bacterium]
MASIIAQLLNSIKEDPWRKEIGFSEDIVDVHNRMFSPDASDGETAEALGTWLQRWQPCLFGRIAAKLGLITFCILSEGDLNGSDEAIHGKIQDARLAWTKQAYSGKKSAFVILAASPQIAFAVPDATLMKLAERLCFLYLEEPIAVDTIHLDQLFLEKPDAARNTWRFYTGVNYFSSQGDKRWWNDHRIPGGMAFSVNSVAHLVKSGQIANNLADIKKEFGFSMDDEWIGSSVDSLEDALIMAMRTISLASETPSGKATELIGLADSDIILPECPITLPRGLSEKNYCEYRGYYHTDHTVPSIYFDSSVDRPADQSTYSLDFTYLFHDDLGNPDHFTMGRGKQIRDDGDQSEQIADDLDKDNYQKGKAEVVPITFYEGRIADK